MSQVGRLKYTADKWNVEIDGYSIPFPDLKLARGYLAYIRLWADYGEVISYDHANQTLFWSKYPPVSCRGCQLSRRHRGIHRYNPPNSKPRLRQRTPAYENTTNHNRN